jgi:hypothetical protein
MKNAMKYQKKVRKLLSGMDKPPPPETPDDANPFLRMIRFILEADAA